MHYNKDTLVARKSLWNAGRKQENPFVFVPLDGIKWRVREAHDVETKKNSSHRSTVYVTSPRHVNQPRFTTLRLPRQRALCVRGSASRYPATPPDTQHEHRDREREGPDTSKRVSRAGGSIGVGGRREAEEGKKLLDASKSKNDCNAEERSSSAVSYAGGAFGVFALMEERERKNRTIWDPRNPTKTSSTNPDPAAAATVFPPEPTEEATRRPDKASSDDVESGTPESRA